MKSRLFVLFKPIYLKLEQYDFVWFSMTFKSEWQKYYFDAVHHDDRHHQSFDK